MTEDTNGGRWRVSYSTEPSLTLSKWRSDVHFPDPERPYMITVGVMFNALAENGMPDLSVQRELLDGIWNDLRADLPRYGRETRPGGAFRASCGRQPAGNGSCCLSCRQYHLDDDAAQ
jgi:hypothetical protein